MIQRHQPYEQIKCYCVQTAKSEEHEEEAKRGEGKILNRTHLNSARHYSACSAHLKLRHVLS